MAQDDKKFKVTGADVTVTLQEVKPPDEDKISPPKPNYLANILFVALIFETILIVTYAFGEGGTAAAGKAARIWLPEIRAAVRSSTNRVLARERNAALRKAETAVSEADERSWRLVSKILDQVKDEIADRIETQLAQTLSDKQSTPASSVSEQTYTPAFCPASCTHP